MDMLIFFYRSLKMDESLNMACLNEVFTLLFHQKETQKGAWRFQKHLTSNIDHLFSFCFELSLSMGGLCYCHRNVGSLES